MKAMMEQAMVTTQQAEQQESAKLNGYQRPDVLKQRKINYLNNLDRNKQTVWGYPIEEVTVSVPVWNGHLVSGYMDINAVKLGHLYFYVKDEITPEYSYTAPEIKQFLLDGDIGVWVDELMVTKGYFMDFDGGVDNPDNYQDKVFACIGATFDQNPFGDWQIFA